MRITIRQCEDWIAVYKDGKRVESGHSCDLCRGLEALGIKFEYVDLYEEVNDLGELSDGSDPFPEAI